MTAKLRVAKWETFQHYKDRAPPWIKLHRSLMTSETWVSASTEGRVLAVACMMLAADTGNEIPANSRYIRRVAYLDFEPDFVELVDLGFLEWIEKPRENDDPPDDASAVLADARPETEQSRAETELEPDDSCASGDALEPEHIVEHWNEIAPTLGKPCIRKLTPARRSLLKARIAQNGLEDFVEVFANIRASPFLRGDKGWHGCTFDWVFKQANFQKILEGNYNEQPAR